jgi:hypothetical protein
MQIDSFGIECFADGKIGRGATIGDVDHAIGSVFYYMAYAALTARKPAWRQSVMCSTMIDAGHLLRCGQFEFMSGFAKESVPPRAVTEPVAVDPDCVKRRIIV